MYRPHELEPGPTAGLVEFADKAAVGRMVRLRSAALGLKPSPGLKLGLDVGVTFSDGSGVDVVKRVYWSNQNTGIVNDEVFELKLEPRNWGFGIFR